MSDLSPVDRMLTLARETCDVFVIPAEPFLFTGQAWCDEGRCFITVFRAERDTMCAYIVAHELAHHLLQHTRYFSSAPHWLTEHDADVIALEMLGKVADPACVAALRDASRAYLRRCVQAMLDAGITQHGEIEAGLDLGCEIDPALLAAHRRELARRDLAPDDTEIPF